jgi:hypothetical protein
VVRIVAIIRVVFLSSVMCWRMGWRIRVAGA